MYSILGLDEPLRERRRTFIQVTVLALTLSLAIPELGVGGDGVLCFDYAAYALGSRLSAPLDLWETSACAACTSHLDANGDAPRHPNAINGKPAILHAPYAYSGTKAGLKRKQHVVEEAASVLVVGRDRGVGDSCVCFFLLYCTSLHPSTPDISLLPRTSIPAFVPPPSPSPPTYTRR
jgi:hypothetical protein